MRNLLRALGTKNEARYNLKIIDNGPEDSERPARSERTVEKLVPIEEVVIDEQPSHSSVVSNTRKELEELDDLDV